MNLKVLLLLVLLLSKQLNAQIQFTSFPKSLQLFPRNLQNKSAVIVSGVSQNLHHRKIILQIKKDNNFFIQRFANLTEQDRNFNFSVEIDAGLHEYSFEIYSVDAQNSNYLEKKAEKVLCGDAFIIYGQSNSIGFDQIDTMYFKQKYRKYLRNITLDGENSLHINWHEGAEPYASIGIFGMLLGARIQKEANVPICIINRGVGGANILSLSRNQSNPNDENTYYGQLLNITERSGLKNHIKSIIWRQGESDASSNDACFEYNLRLRNLMNNFFDDFIGLEKIYVAQNNIISTAFCEATEAGLLRNSQRKIGELNPKIVPFSTIGVRGYDGLHYNYFGHKQVADYLSKLIGRDIYNANPQTRQLESPNAKIAYYNSSKDSLTIIFNEASEMIYPSDSTLGGYTRSLKDFFYFDNPNQKVESGVAVGNRIILKINGYFGASKINYLPPFFADTYSQYYDGPFLKNSSGVSAFSFVNLDIGNEIVGKPDIIIIPQPDKVELIVRNNHLRTNRIVVERSEFINKDFIKLAEIPINNCRLTDSIVTAEKKYFYKIYFANSTAYSTPSNLMANTTLQNLDLSFDFKDDIMEIRGNSIKFQGVIERAKLVLKSQNFVEITTNSKIKDSVVELSQ